MKERRWSEIPQSTNLFRAGAGLPAELAFQEKPHEICESALRKVDEAAHFAERKKKKKQPGGSNALGIFSVNTEGSGDAVFPVSGKLRSFGETRHCSKGR